MAVPTLLRRKEVEAATGLSRAHLYHLMRTGDFPEPLKLSPRVVRWLEHEVTDWIVSRDRASGDVASDSKRR